MARANIEDDTFIKGFLDDAVGTDPSDNSGDQGEVNAQSGNNTQAQEQPGNEQPAQAPKQDQQQAPAQQDSGSSGANGKPQQADPKQAKEGNPNPRDLRLDDGTVVKAGMERRWYENMRIARDQAESYRKKAETHEQTIANLQQQIQTHQQSLQTFGSTDPRELSDSLRLFRDMRTNPTGTLKNLIAELAAAGVSLDGVVSGLDTRVMQAMLDQRLPSQQQQQQQQGPSAEDTAKQEATEFVKNFPDALLHQDVILRLAQQNPTMKLTDIYWELRKQAADNGYEWSQPLAPQHQSRQQQQQNPQNRQKPMPQGNGTGGMQLDNAQDVKQVQQAEADESYDSIIRSVLKDYRK